MTDGSDRLEVPAPRGDWEPASAEYAAGSTPLLQFSVEEPERLSRWLIFVKVFLLIPHFAVLWLLGVAFGITTIIAFFAILITGQYPRPLWDFGLLFLRWTANVETYLYLQSDEYPPFAAGPYPARLDLAYPTEMSRWQPLVKWLLVMPNAFVLSFVKLAALVAVVIAFFAILFTGQYPSGLFQFVTGANRWNYRVNAYAGLMTDAYPPFSLE